MRIKCPLCGSRDRREFYYQGHASILDRPDPESTLETWNNYLHNRENLAGVTEDLWHHEQGCGAWLVVKRNTVSHEVLSARLAKENGL
ncbi:MAG: sarcosine oxidase subunit delta [Planktomarina sp.]|nr:sarcosine oxidase subunit delta [Planktomarina sp.]MDT2033094.1 sarcosine oxidase subunit delta [Planktomarina sp.]MDT2039555.1 sarcosine oxidase subunit delta [Planktomarina sp.]MDT2049314.1 sarcosine oxidase subunit delta [Planktomarina sp.]|tara:strand:+ start:267 stop:530 length:264 start_codon:yes stop_codon:yes gene_type:complete